MGITYAFLHPIVKFTFCGEINAYNLLTGKDDRFKEKRENYLRRLELYSLKALKKVRAIKPKANKNIIVRIDSLFLP